MEISDISKYNWEKSVEWFEKWYDTELCYRVLGKGNNPLTKLLKIEGINVLALNTFWYYDEIGSKYWDKNREESLTDTQSALKKLTSQSENYLKEAEKIIHQIELIKEIDEVSFEKIKYGLTILWYVFLADLGRFLAPLVDKKLQDKGLNKEDVEQVKNYYFTSQKQLAYQLEAGEFKKIVKVYKKRYGSKKVRFQELSEDIKSLLVFHWEQYAFLTNLDLDIEPVNVEDYFRRLLLVQKNKQQFKEKKMKLNSEIKKKLNKEDLEILNLINKHIYLDNYTADLYAKLDYLMQGLISKKFSISFKELTWYSFSELESMVMGGDKISNDNILKRQKYRVMVQIDGEIEVFYGKNEYKRIKKIVDPSHKKVKADSFSGIVAAPGQARGFVKVIHGVKEIDKVKKGDILVSNATRPDYMSAILKCAAIVTDWGGITSHAAIISRELKIPCIVGTNIATQVLKDGDKVEVDAEKGFVRKLN